MGPSVPSHWVLRMRSKHASDMTKRSTWNVVPWRMTGASWMTLGQVILSPLATVAVSRGRGWMGSLERWAARSPMKLCVDLVSRRATTAVVPRDARTYMVS
jgi:hypothetical protein